MWWLHMLHCAIYRYVCTLEVLAHILHLEGCLQGNMATHGWWTLSLLSTSPSSTMEAMNSMAACCMYMHLLYRGKFCEWTFLWIAQKWYMQGEMFVGWEASWVGHTYWYIAWWEFLCTKFTKSLNLPSYSLNAIHTMWSGCGRMGLWYKQVSLICDTDTVGTLYMHSPSLFMSNWHPCIEKSIRRVVYGHLLTL